MKAQELLDKGIAAVRDEKDLTKGRNLLTQLLRLEPENDQAWMWLSRTVSDPEKRRQCLERAISLNPKNEKAKAMLERLNKGLSTITSEMRVVSDTTAQTPEPRSTVEMPIAASPFLPAKATTPAQQQQIKAALAKAKGYLDKDDPENAIEQWVRVLEIEPDHEVALASAVRHLSRMKYLDDAKELVWNAINSGSDHPSVYMTALDIARREKNDDQADDLREKLAVLPTVSEEIAVEQIDYFLKTHQFQRALHILESAVGTHPKSQKIWLRMGNLLEDMHKHDEAIPYFRQVLKLGAGTPEGKQASEKVDVYAPTLSDHERGSMLLAVREAFGLGLFIFLLAWLDSGLNFAQMGAARLGGVVLGFLGSYLLITATSSPQQQPLAKILGGQIPEPEEAEKDEFGHKIIKEVSKLPVISPGIRAFLGLVGLLIVGFSVYLVFSRTIQLLGNPNPPPFYIPTFDEWYAQVFG